MLLCFAFSDISLISVSIYLTVLRDRAAFSGRFVLWSAERGIGTWYRVQERCSLYSFQEFTVATCVRLSFAWVTVHIRTEAGKILAGPKRFCSWKLSLLLQPVVFSDRCWPKVLTKGANLSWKVLVSTTETWFELKSGFTDFWIQEYIFQPDLL